MARSVRRTMTERYKSNSESKTGQEEDIRLWGQSHELIHIGLGHLQMRSVLEIHRLALGMYREVRGYLATSISWNLLSATIGQVYLEGFS